MGVEDYRSQAILRKVKPSDLENGSRRSRLAHDYRKNRDGRWGGLISWERRSWQQLVYNYGVEEWAAAARNCNSFESREVPARRDHRGNSALWIRKKFGSKRKELAEQCSGSNTGDADLQATNAMPRIWMMPAAARRLKGRGLLSSGSNQSAKDGWMGFSDRQDSVKVGKRSNTGQQQGTQRASGIKRPSTGNTID